MTGLEVLQHFLHSYQRQLLLQLPLQFVPPMVPVAEKLPEQAADGSAWSCGPRETSDKNCSNDLTFQQVKAAFISSLNRNMARTH
ncbi:MAG: hypothetical protein AB8B36_13015 [Prochlorococcus sp.]